MTTHDDTFNPRLGFEEPFPMVTPSPGVDEMTLLYSRYAEQMRIYDTYTAAMAPPSTTTDTTQVVLR